MIDVYWIFGTAYPKCPECWSKVYRRSESHHDLSGRFYVLSTHLCLRCGWEK